MKENALHIEDLSVCYGQAQALSGVYLDVPKGAYLGIMGPNGGGKSTLLKAILGLIPLRGGKIEIFGDDSNRQRDKIGYVPQFAAMDRRFPISVFEVAMTGCLKPGLHPFFQYSKQDKNAANQALERLDILRLAKRQISELSGGEFQRLLIARALASAPKLLLLDEPTASIDPGSREHIYSLLHELNLSGMTVILVTHDLMAISSNVDSLACLNQTLVYHGEPELSEDIVTQMYGCPVDLIAHGVPHRVLGNHEGGCCHD